MLCKSMDIHRKRPERFKEYLAQEIESPNLERGEKYLEGTLEGFFVIAARLCRDDLKVSPSHLIHFLLNAADDLIDTPRSWEVLAAIAEKRAADMRGLIDEDKTVKELSQWTVS